MAFTIDDYINHEYQFTSKWEVSFIIAPALFKYRTLKAMCTAAQLPSWSVGELSASLGPHTYTQPGMMTYSNTMTFEFLEPIDDSLMGLIEAWKNMMHTFELGTSVHRLLKTGIIRVIMYDNENNKTGAFYITDVWLQSVDYGQLVSESGQLFKPTLTFQYNQFIWLPI